MKIENMISRLLGSYLFFMYIFNVSCVQMKSQKFLNFLYQNALSWIQVQFEGLIFPISIEGFSDEIYSDCRA